MKIEQQLDLHKTKFSWLRFEQQIPFELEESVYWLLGNLEINRFSFEYNPENKYIQNLFVWVPLNEFSVSKKKTLVKSLKLLAKTFELTLPPCKWTEVKEEDWSLIWKKNWKPDAIGRSILILPSWLEVPQIYSDRKIILLDPGSAFGTGSHPSTRLCLEALDEDPPIGKTIADLGCGSGILALTSLKLGASSAFCVDTDSLAISATKTNFFLNNFSESLLNVSLGSIKELSENIPVEKIDLMLCNILAPVIKSLGSDFDKIMANQGKVILSGLLVDQIKEIQDFFSPLGWAVLDIRTKDQWASLELTRKSFD